MGGEEEYRPLTEAEKTDLRRKLYLTIMSAASFEECAHKLLKLQLPDEEAIEVVTMILECCSQERSYQRFYGLLGQRLCEVNNAFQEKFEETFAQQYGQIHRLETNKLRNVGRFFAHLLYTDALQWTLLGYIKLTEEDTTSSSRIFIKIVFQEIAENMGLTKLNERLRDDYMAEYFEGLFPRDNPKNTRFSINFFTSIGLGGAYTHTPDTHQPTEHIGGCAPRRPSISIAMLATTLCVSSPLSSNYV